MILFIQLGAERHC